MNDFEGNLLSLPVSNLTGWLDVPAAVDYFLITEITKNPGGHTPQQNWWQAHSLCTGCMPLPLEHAIVTDALAARGSTFASVPAALNQLRQPELPSCDPQPGERCRAARLLCVLLGTLSEPRRLAPHCAVPAATAL